jgi:hypothetical protein
MLVLSNSRAALCLQHGSAAAAACSKGAGAGSHMVCGWSLKIVCCCLSLKPFQLAKQLATYFALASCCLASSSSSSSMVGFSVAIAAGVTLDADYKQVNFDEIISLQSLLSSSVYSQKLLV